MAKVKYDVRDVESSGNFEVPPTGVYSAVLTECKSTTSSRTDSPMLECIYELDKGDFKGLKLWDYVVLTDEARWKLRQFLEAVDLTEVNGKKGAKGTLDTDAVEGTQVQVRIKHETYEEEKKAKIAAVLPLGEGDDDDDDDDLSANDDDYTYEDLEDMDLDDLKNVIDEEELDIKVTKRSKVETILAKVAEELDLEPSSEDDDDDDDEELTAEEVEEMDLDELKELIEEEELEIKVTSRSKAEKVAAKVIEELELEDDDDDDDDDENQDYSEMSAAELKAECKERGLKATGKTSILVARLEKDDEEDDEDPFA